MTSLSSQIIERIGQFRNPSTQTAPRELWKSVLAEIAYITTIPIAIVESAITHVANVVARCLPINPQKYQMINNWKTSSATAFFWSIYCVMHNIFSPRLFSTETQFTQYMFNARNLIASYLSPPINPIVIDTEISKLLENYEVATHAKRYSEAFEKLYRDLPEPTQTELSEIGTDIQNLLSNRYRVKHLIDGMRYDHQHEWAKRFLKMLIAVKKTLIARNDPSELEAFQGALEVMFQNCSNRKSTDLENIFITYVAPHLRATYTETLTATECLVYDLTQYRCLLRDKIINTICNDAHNAASHNFFRRELNQSVFMLPPSPLSTEDLAHSDYAMKMKREAIISAFNQSYDSPKTIYKVFSDMLYPKPGDTTQFKSTHFIAWLQEKERMNADSFTDEDMTQYKPTVIIDFLVDHGFLKPRSPANQ